ERGPGGGLDAVGGDLDDVGKPLVVHAAGSDGHREVHPRVEDVEDDLDHAGGDVRAARAADGEEHPFRAVLLEDKRGGHRRDGDPSRGDGIVLAVDQSVDVRDARLGGEVVHLVVEEHPGAAGDEAAPEAVVDGGGERDRVPGAVEDGDLGGVL